MKRRYLLPLLALLLVRAIACTDEKESEGRLPERPDDPADCISTVACPDQGTPSDTSGFRIFGGAAAMWESSFGFHYGVDSSLLPFHVSIPAQTLRAYLKSHGGDSAYYDGFKLYFGLTGTAGDRHEVPGILCLVVVPYRNNADTVFPASVGPCIVVDIDGITQNVAVDTAEGYVANWRAHYVGMEEDYFPRIDAYSFSGDCLWENIDTALSNGYNDTVSFLFGCHTIAPGDEYYCVQQPAGFPDTYGFIVTNLVVATRKENQGEWSRGSDFVRPCPRFCGTTLFEVYCP